MNLFWQITCMCLLLKTVKSTFKNEDLKSGLSNQDGTISFQQLRQLDEKLTTKFHSKFREMEYEHHLQSQKIKKSRGNSSAAK